MELTEIKGIGKARKQSFEENGIFSCEDLINYFPYKYYDFTKTEPYADDGKVRLIKAQVTDNAKVVRARNNLQFVTCKMIDENGHTFTAMWFNQTYMASNLYIGLEIYLYGKNSPTKKNTFIVNLSKNADSLKKLGYLPVYKTMGSVGQKVLHDSINLIFESLNLSTFISNYLLQKYNLIDLRDAYYQIHNPENDTNFDLCYERIEIENLIPLIAVNEYHKLVFREEKNQKYNNIENLLNEFESHLPFKLTIDQKNAMHDIEKDFKSKFSMNRLLQGDVGSGKTLVSLFGAYLAIKNGYQATIVAPTEILANQHFQTVLKFFKESDVRPVLLTGSTKGLERTIALQQIKNGDANLIIGTHAVLSDSVMFKNLSYIVIDEQHRFGVEQRKTLKNKGITPDILIMSATPIPRSLSLVVYGELDISYLKSRPKPQQITTNIVIKTKQNDMWNYIEQKISNGSKVYVVCSKIDEENEDDDICKFSAKNMYSFLSQRFKNEQVGLIHGKLSKETQSRTIEKFKNGQIKILVSTTIVEVGVDIPDSDIMIIATPERFGLATLHQLRGRVGRDGSEAFCFCLADNLNEKSYDRISFFKNHYDGFEIAEFDLKTRGSGSFLGTNQHGHDNGLIDRFSSEAYARAKEILEWIKTDINLYKSVLEKGEILYSSNILSKVILN